MAKAKTKAALSGPGKVPVSVLVNGLTRKAELEPCITLLDAMREHWGLTGAKRVCDRATCGACTVLVNGARVYACGLLAIDVQGDEITTVESLDRGGALDPVQEAFVAADALQCGFCTCGFVVSATAFLAENPDPTPAQIRKGMCGNLCRCGTYVGVQEAVSAAAKALSKAARPPARRAGGKR